jgi:hypothetical protein
MEQICRLDYKFFKLNFQLHSTFQKLAISSLDDRLLRYTQYSTTSCGKAGAGAARKRISLGGISLVNKDGMLYTVLQYTLYYTVLATGGGFLQRKFIHLEI